MDRDPRRWRMLALVSIALLLGMSGWFTAAAIAPEVQRSWGLSAQAVGWLTTVVQLGFVAGTALAAVLNLADVVPHRAYFGWSVTLAAAANAVLVFDPGYPGALVARFATGFFLAGVYPPAMKMIATWFRSARGLAIGTVVGALTVGKATPYLLKAFGGASISVVVLGASLAGGVAAVMVLLGYRDGPFSFAKGIFSWSLIMKIFRHRQTMLATGGYLGHMWELYAMWTWVTAFLAASVLSTPGGPSTSTVELVGFGAIAAGGLGCVWGGWAADRIGREPVTMVAMGVSGACCLTVGLLFSGNFWVLAAMTWVWGFFVVADSAQFSAIVTEVAPSGAVGTALTLQTSLGFLLTMVTIQATPALQEALGWSRTFPLLALGPAVGIIAMARLRRQRAVSA